MTKNKGGRPPTYKTKEEMQIKIDEYFDCCKGEYLKNEDGEFVLNKFGEPVMINVKVPTVTGLALALGFNSRRSLLDYSVKKEFLHTVARAKSRVEEYAESRLFDRDGARGAEFSLRCNFKWNDKQADDAKEDAIINADKILVSIRKAAKEGNDDAKYRVESEAD